MFDSGVITNEHTSAARTRLLSLSALILCAAVAVRAIHLGAPSLWSDELFSRYYADLFGLRYLWTTGLYHEDTPPLYYMALQGWMGMFGSGEAAIRSLSVVASVLAVPLAFLLGKSLFDERRGLIAAAILALSPMQISFAQDARAYALLLLPVGTVLLAIAGFLRDTMRARSLVLYGAGAITAIYCHATAAFFIAACNTVVIAYILADPRLDRRAALLRWVTANAIVAIVAIPEFIAMVRLGGSGVSWIPPLTAGDVARSFSALVAGVATPARFPGVELTVAVLFGAVACVAAAGMHRRAAAVIIAIPLMFTVLLAAASLVHPIFIARALCWLGLPLAVVIADGIARPAWPRPYLLTAVLLTGVVGLGYQFTMATNEPWRELLQQLRPDLDRADRVILAPLTDPTAFAYYAPGLAHLATWDIGLRGTIETDAMPRRMDIPSITRAQIIEAIRSGHNVWLFLRTPDLAQVTALLDELPPPRVNIERYCGGNVMCLAAKAW